MNDKNLLIEGYQNPVPLSLSCFLCYVKDDKFLFGTESFIYLMKANGVVGGGLGWIYWRSSKILMVHNIYTDLSL